MWMEDYWFLDSFPELFQFPWEPTFHRTLPQQALCGAYRKMANRTDEGSRVQVLGRTVNMNFFG
jgi:hypothetical protein